MKKMMSALLVATLLAGCSSTGTASTGKTSSKTEEKPATLKVGVGAVSEVKGADVTADKEGSGQVDTTVASVALDGDTIKYVYFDVAQDKVAFDATGAITKSDEKAPTKKVKKEDYGMKKASKIGKEWYEQVDFLEKWAIGKNVKDVIGMKTEVKNDHEITTDADLLTGCTIEVKDFLAALNKAVESAVEVQGATKVGTSVRTGIKATAATAEKSGQFQQNVTFGVVATDKDGKIVTTLTNVAQNAVKFTATGTLDGEPKAIPTKVERKEDYGMKKASKIGKEWYEQNAHFDTWTVGKTGAEVGSTPTEKKDEEHMVATDADLVSGCTMSPTELIEVVKTAAESATELK